MIGEYEFLVIFFIFGIAFTAVGALIMVIPFWMICKKAGFPAALSLLMLVPIGNIILWFYLAFAAWPALRQAPAQSYGPPQSPPSLA